MAKLIVEMVGFKGDLEFDTSKSDGTPRKLLDVSRLAKLGWVASTSLEEELRLTYEDFLSGIDCDSVRNLHLADFSGNG